MNHKRYIFLLLCGILFVGAFLRNHNSTVWPREGATFDEFAWTFQGVSILTKGVPTSWSPHLMYKNRVAYQNPQGTAFTLVTPYLEHPPLFGLVAGGFAYFRGVRNFDDVTIAKIRPLGGVLGILSILAVYLLASGIYGPAIGLLASGIYAITPTAAVGSRLVQNENFFIPLFLFALYFTHRYLMEKKTPGLSLNFFVILCLCALAPLAKVPWVASPLGVAGILWYSRKWKAGLGVLGAGAVGFLLYVLYGYLLDGGVFLSLMKFQTSRYAMDFDSLYVLFRDPLIADRLFVDGWIYAGWLSLICLLTDINKKNIYVIFGFFAYAAIFVFAIPSEAGHGWYRYPFYPFLSIATAVFLKNYFNVNYFLTSVFLVVTGTALLGTSFGRLFGFSYPLLRIYLAAVFMGMLPGIFPGLKGKKIFPWINRALMVFIIFLSFWSIYLYNEQ